MSFSGDREIPKNIIMKFLQNMYACGICHESFSLAKSLLTHVQMKHAQESEEKKNTKFSNATLPEKDKREKLLQDDPTGIEQSSEKSSLKSLENTSFSNRLQVCDKIHTREKPYPCNVCHKKFSTLQTRKKHQMIHTGEKPYPCRHCERKFNQTTTKNRHERICPLVASKNIDLNIDTKPFACSFCA